MKITTAVILAAGRGVRLRPLTLERSKAMIAIAGKPIIERVMETLVANGVDDFILVTSPTDRHILPYFREECQIEASVRFVQQPEPRGTADALRCATSLIHSDFVLSACDSLISPAEVGRMLSAWESQPPLDALLCLTSVGADVVSRMAIVEMERTWVRRIVEKPKLECGQETARHQRFIASLPHYCFSPRILEILPEVRLSPRGEYELPAAIQLLIERGGGVSGVMVTERLTLTTPADLPALERHFSGGNHA